MFSQRSGELVFSAVARSKAGVDGELPRQEVSSQMLLLVNRHLTTSTSDQLSLRSLLHVMPALETIVSISCRKVSL